MNLNEMTIEELFTAFAVSYGKSALDPTNNMLKNDLEKCKSELQKRYSNEVTTDDLKDLVASEYTIIGLKRVDEIFQKMTKLFGLTKGNNEKVKLIICMDGSGSMGSFERYISKAFMFWSEKFLTNQYKDIEKLFVTFNTKASRVYGENEFYSQSESGGTIASSGLNKVNELINQYDYKNTDTFVFVLSDGDNLTSDNETFVRTLMDIERKTNYICYLEINQYNRCSTLQHGLKISNFNSPKFSKHIVREKAEVYKALTELWSVNR